ncbi:DUF2157 domain-containing protein [Phyllobacterium sp. YR531]|uniref:DUF2157 domain-containing protein n=1 Tax=Phyllobacterium sp. YR531 TaxID=1144343 RepID=UPI00026FA173|nr:DUF2157 domain-containing protein [Phyllobacterium sp. YR531]EJN03426.1 putative membrane protein [Phyllobacterium sp. YR531]
MAFSIGIKKHIARWQQAGLIDEGTADLLRKDVEKTRSGFGLGGILAVLGAVLLGAAIISLVAANWEAMPRLVRVVMIISVLWIGYVGGAWRASLGEKMLSQALYLIAAITFGAGIALIGQMYHLSGEATEAALLWAAGTMIAALCLRSPVLVATGVAIVALYLFLALDGGNDAQNYAWLLPVLLFVSAGLVWYTKAEVARHFIALVLIAYVFAIHEEFDDDWILWLAAAAGGVLFLTDALATPTLQRLIGWSKAIGAYGFLMLLLVVSYFQFERFDGEVQDQVIIGFGILACTIAGLVLSGYRNLAVRWMAYTVFSLEVLYLAFKTVGTLIGTASFFLCAGVLVLLLAAFVVRMERRLQKKIAQAEGAA